MHNTNPKNDNELIAAAQAGDDFAKSELYNRYIKLLFGYLYNRLGATQDVEDICQETFLRAFKGLNKFAGRASFKNWIFQIAKNIVADHWKKHYAQPTVLVDDFYGFGESPTSEIDEEFLEQEQRKSEKTLRSVLDQLSDDYRTILELRFLKGYTIKESAEELSISISNAKIRQFRAIKKAQTLIQGND